MRRTFNFGKYAIANPNRRANEVTVEMEIRTTAKGPELSICGEAWNSRHTDCVIGGQCLDTLKKSVKHNKVFNELHRLWKNYHLNGMHTGTVEQDKAIEDSKVDGTWETCQKRLDEQKAKECPYSKPTASHYEVACEVLKEKGMYEVKLEDGTYYNYGHGWLYRAIPNEDWDIINKLMDTNNSMEDLKAIL